MEDTFQVFDFYRIFIGEDPPLFMLEIVFRTLIMYGYTIILLRVLGKRGMGQLSMLELAIIISFGSAVGDPMVGPDMPIFHGMIAITVVTFFQIGFEKLINKSKFIECRLEGKPSLVILKGVIQWHEMAESNLSREDLFRLLRGKDIKHLGQIERAYFETSGQISVMLFPNDKIFQGLPVIPEDDLDKDLIFKKEGQALHSGQYACMGCGEIHKFNDVGQNSQCLHCKSEKWLEIK